MAEFVYIAKDQRGESMEGVLDAASRSVAASQLRERGWVIISIRNQAGSRGSESEAREWVANPFVSIRSVHVETSLQQLALMVKSGMTLLASIEACKQQTSSRGLARVWAQVANDIQKGGSFHQALEAHRCFPEFVVRLVAVGEKTGNLEQVLRRASTSLKNRRKARDDFWSATIYPAIVVLLSIFVTIYMVVYLIPKLDVYLQSLGKEMPAMTQSLVNMTGWFTDNFAAMAIISISIAVLFTIFYLSEEGKRLVDYAILRTPILGNMVALSETTTFSQSLGMMLASGITLTEGLGASQPLIRNRHLADLVARAKDKIMRGSNLSEALKQKVGFTPMLSQMVVVGQQSGELEQVLSEVAELHQEQFQASVKRLNAMLTPALTLIIGGIVGYVYIAFFVALFAAGS